MLIRLGYDIELKNSQPHAIIGVLNVHPSRVADLLEPDQVKVSPEIPVEVYSDCFGNRCTRLSAPAGMLRLSNSTLIRDSGQPDPVDWDASQVRHGDTLGDGNCAAGDLRTPGIERLGHQCAFPDE